MTHLLLLLVFIIFLPVTIQAQGAAYAGRGHTGAADASDAFAGLWNPAALAILPGKGVVLQPHLSLLSDDLKEITIGLHYNLPKMGTIGGYFNYSNLGTQMRTSYDGDLLGAFESYGRAFTASLGYKITSNSAVGFNLARIHQHHSELRVGGEDPSYDDTSYVFDLGYYQRELVLSGLDMGLSIRNMGGQFEGIQAEMADPRPVKFALGFKWRVVEMERNGITLYYDLNKLLVASYPNVDHDGDGIIGGYDEDGTPRVTGRYSRDGDHERAHTDPWYRALITSWYDDWLYGGDIDRDGDRIIGEDEEGNQDEGSLKDELRTLTPHTGIEWRFLTHYTVRAGMIHDRIGKIRKYTLGAGIRFRSFRIDWAYIPGREFLHVAAYPGRYYMLISTNLTF